MRRENRYDKPVMCSRAIAIPSKGACNCALRREEEASVDALEDGGNGYAVLARTPFYVEAGGQVSDQGWLHSGAGRSRVSGVARPGPGRRGRIVSRRSKDGLRFATS